MTTRCIESTAAYLQTRWRVGGLTLAEQAAVRNGGIVWFTATPWDHRESGVKVVVPRGDQFFGREPTPDELAAIAEEVSVECPECERDLGAEATSCSTCSGGER